ncbi:lipopolysaccharide transport system ATP-binding protein [Chitinophaga sp. CF118]|uniref:ABC transporter ATP-binding protein n=1 Tax=Chitinophaga sp. CF118 TaxID=1884367 RepID=UPI0008EE0D5B|nr:ABC transporter ATP-binding protein [Chitinophaga sp. CF118]SFE51125.1 lipopolysaccharide transport system ATP-binding protein [Chitinophaga sp. CF118]
MTRIMIKAENVSKYYNLGKLGSGRLREDFKDWWVRSVLKNGNNHNGTETRSHIWALKDVSFEVSEGEVLGFIGNNGAGKSTLLRILSRITAPSYGTVMGNGRVASLLEVGTGFHAELTGRENIYLNGHILGMKKKEIASRFDEILDFSGVEKFIDTPVKRYSTGMYMRLAFAVAAHMEPDILIVDEVLAVGDAEFQRKCIGKMKEVSSQKGKTVLFVSHNLQALQNLCQRVIVIHQGQIVDEGEPEAVIGSYLKKEKNISCFQEYDDMSSAPGNDSIRIKRVELIPEYVNGQQVIDIRTPVTIHFEFWYLEATSGNLIVGVHLYNFRGDFIFDVCSEGAIYPSGLIEGKCSIPGNFLNDDSYYISIVFVKDTTNRLYYFEGCLSFDVEDYRKNTAWFGKWQGFVRPAFPVTLTTK